MKGIAKIMNTNLRRRLLFVFDFDHTIIDKNTDGQIIRKLEEINGTRDAKKEGDGWSKTMSNTLKGLYQSKILKGNIDEIIMNIPLTPGFIDVFDILRKNMGQYDCFILSHSNKYFIDILLEKFQVKDIFKVVHTYDGEWINDDKQLVVKPYDELSYNCDICPNDFCKGKFIESHLKLMSEKESTLYDSVIYVGDGSADYCAALHLSKSDYILVRKSYSMHRRIESSGDSLEAKYSLWEDGTDVANFLCNMMEIKS